MNTTAAIVHIDTDFAVADLDNDRWQDAAGITVDCYWNAEPSPIERLFQAKLLWSNASFYVRFDANQHEPLVVSEKPDVASKTIGLWERDVCEVFIAPNADDRNKYFEFEIAPTGEWIDLGIEITSNGRTTDWNYRSNMTSAARVENDKVVMAIKIPFAALGKTPNNGDVWLGNVFRCVGSGAERGYLAWQPTKTSTPNFHVPEVFGKFEFVK